MIYEISKKQEYVSYRKGAKIKVTYQEKKKSNT